MNDRNQPQNVLRDTADALAIVAKQVATEGEVEGANVAELLLCASEAVACLRLVATMGTGVTTTTETKIYKGGPDDLNEGGLKRLNELLEFRNAVVSAIGLHEDTTEEIALKDVKEICEESQALRQVADELQAIKSASAVAIASLTEELQEARDATSPPESEALGRIAATLGFGPVTINNATEIANAVEVRDKFYHQVNLWLASRSGSDGASLTGLQHMALIDAGLKEYREAISRQEVDKGILRNNVADLDADNATAAETVGSLDEFRKEVCRQLQLTAANNSPAAAVAKITHLQSNALRTDDEAERDAVRLRLLERFRDAVNEVLDVGESAGTLVACETIRVLQDSFDSAEVFRESVAKLSGFNVLTDASREAILEQLGYLGHDHNQLAVNFLRRIKDELNDRMSEPSSPDDRLNNFTDWFEAEAESERQATEADEVQAALGQEDGPPDADDTDIRRVRDSRLAQEDAEQYARDKAEARHNAGHEDESPDAQNMRRAREAGERFRDRRRAEAIAADISEEENERFDDEEDETGGANG